MGAISHSPDSVGGEAESQQAGTAVSFSDSSANKLFRSISQVPPKPMATLLPTYFRAGVSPLSAEASSVILNNNLLLLKPPKLFFHNASATTGV